MDIVTCFEIKVFPKIEILQFPNLNIGSLNLLLNILKKDNIKYEGHFNHITFPTMTDLYNITHQKILLMKFVDYNMIIGLSFFDILPIISKTNSTYNLKAFW